MSTMQGSCEIFSQTKHLDSNRGCIATLNTLKKVVQNYDAPLHSIFSRHLMAHVSSQSAHLTRTGAQPASIAVSNALRWLNFKIGSIDMDMSPRAIKDIVCLEIDDYINNRIIRASGVIQSVMGMKIKDGDVIMTFGRSSTIERILLAQKREGRRISVLVIDSGPHFEGRALLSSLTSGSNPVCCTYGLLSALPSLLEEASMVLVDAHAIFANGAVYSGAGTAVVAMMAKDRNIPFLVCCETYKFSDSVMIDILSESDAELLPVQRTRGRHHGLLKASDIKSLNIEYDLTPPKYVTGVVTELGVIHPNATGAMFSLDGNYSWSLE